MNRTSILSSARRWLRLALAVVLACALYLPVTSAFAAEESAGDSNAGTGIGAATASESTRTADQAAPLFTLGDDEGGRLVPAVPSTNLDQYASGYALYKGDGWLYRCNSNGKVLSNGTLWGRTERDRVDNLHSVHTLFIDSGVTTLPDSLKVKVNYYYYESSKNQTTSSINFNYLTGVSKIVFRTNSSGKNACQYIGDHVFRSCSVQSVVNFNKTQISSIGEYAFEKCTALGSISFPSTLRSINTSAFRNCSSLRSVTIPGTVSQIGASAFSGCSGMETLVIKSGVASIDNYAFDNCTRLAKVDLPATVNKIGYNGFHGCSNLKTVYIRTSSVISSGGSMFTDTPLAARGGGVANGAWFYVPNYLVSQYESKYSSYKDHFRAIPGNKFTRLWGSGPLDTMRKVVQAGWASGCGGTVVVATSGSYYDALSASGVAGLEGAPILMTNGKSLSAQTKAELVRIKPRKVIVAGGPLAVSEGVLDQIKAATGVTPKRIYGAGPRATAAKLNVAYKGRWRTGKAILATSKSFQDALSAAPVAYSQKIPVFLVSGSSVDANTLSAMRQCGVNRVVVLGGTLAVPASVETQLKRAGMTTARLGGKGARETSRKIADWGVALGMSPNRMGVATPATYYDALCGAALCGKNNSVLVLANDKGYANTA
ncbi:MAG: leucine-rich repeat protein, partial [Eggerthellaceae bacterium]|nr:leucine-rich repeat protein [Eggerthellaceae bacterium]